MIRLRINFILIHSNQQAFPSLNSSLRGYLQLTALWSGFSAEFCQRTSPLRKNVELRQRGAEEGDCFLVSALTGLGAFELLSGTLISSPTACCGEKQLHRGVSFKWVGEFCHRSAINISQWLFTEVFSEPTGYGSPFLSPFYFYFSSFNLCLLLSFYLFPFPFSFLMSSLLSSSPPLRRVNNLFQYHG